jgi:ATP-dependent Clp protease ATP-binding subunit ClpC
VIDFKNTVIIMTSNIGAQLINRVPGIGLRSPQKVDEDARAYESMKGKVVEEMKKTFRPEFLNRIDEVVVFHALTSGEILQIVDLMLVDVSKRMEPQQLTLQVSDEAKELLAREGFDPSFGARPLRRAVQRMIEDPLSEQILGGSFGAGDCVLAEVKDGDVVFTKGPRLDGPDTLKEETAGVG